MIPNFGPKDLNLLNESKRLDSNHKLKNEWWMILIGLWKSTIINPPPIVEKSGPNHWRRSMKYGPGLKAYYNHTIQIL